MASFINSNTRLAPVGNFHVKNLYIDTRVNPYSKIFTPRVVWTEKTKTGNPSVVVRRVVIWIASNFKKGLTGLFPDWLVFEDRPECPRRSRLYLGRGLLNSYAGKRHAAAEPEGQ